jgi:O-antigen/teichoic acid export membrane protein
MLNSTSVRLRLLVSIGSNILRAAFSFVAGVFVARALNPSGYGDMMFLLGSFVAVRSLLDMGSSSAFFTFLSQRPRSHRFYFLYFVWLATQFFATLIFLWLIIPVSLFEKIWLGHETGTVMLAYIAMFMQQQLWQMVGQIGEAMRKTIKIQLMNLTVAILYLMLIVLAAAYEWLTVENIFYLMIGNYAIATIFSFCVLKENKEVRIPTDSATGEIMRDYWKYCHPLIVLAFISFVYEFADKWMLQKFGGAAQQGYFQIASQFAAISILATASVLNVFWKEIAHAWENKEFARVEMLYRKVSRGLVMLGAVVSGMLIPWAEQILKVLLGESYASAWLILAIMLLYPIHQSMGQVGGAMMFATGQTKKYTIVSIVMMLVSVPASYFLLAPVNQEWLPGLDLGALGMALKMVVLGLVSVNVQAWIIARYAGWKFDWVFQAVGIPVMIALGYLAKIVAELLLGFDTNNLLSLAGLFMTAGFAYLIGVIGILCLFPSLIGMKHDEMINFFSKASIRFK